MPMYKYRCKKCGYEFSIIITWNEDTKKKGLKCAVCGSDNVKRLITGNPIVFKGSGWTEKENKK